MLQTVYKESKNTEVIGNRKRTNSIFDESDQDTLSPSKKARSEVTRSESSNNIVVGEATEMDRRLEEPSADEEDSDHRRDEIAEPAKEIVSMLLRAFGMSVLGAVQSLPLHNEMDMSLGIAGLHSLKMEREKSLEAYASSAGSSRIAGGKRNHLPMGPEASHPFSMRGPPPSSSTPPSLATIYHEECEDEIDSDIAVVSALSSQLSQASQMSQSQSMDESTTYEERWTQDTAEGSQRSLYDQEERQSVPSVVSVTKTDIALFDRRAPSVSEVPSPLMQPSQLTSPTPLSNTETHSSNSISPPETGEILPIEIPDLQEIAFCGSSSIAAVPLSQKADCQNTLSSSSNSSEQSKSNIFHAIHSDEIAPNIQI